jgi:hypothetical protein
MKKGIFILLLILILPAVKVASQNPNLDKLNTYKIGFFTKKLNLTSQEAEKFWPIYNEYQKQRNQIQQERGTLIRNFNQNESTMSDDQLTEAGDKLIAAIVQESTIAVTFHNKLKEVLPPAKVIKFYQTENQYKAQLLNELQGTRPQQARPQQRIINPRRNF